MGIVHVVDYIELAPVVERIAPMLARHSRLLLVTSLLAAVLFGAGPIDAATPDTYVSDISTRVRVNNYTDVHAVAELSDGKLYVTKTFVKASGGCSAPAAKNADEARNRLGQMRYRQFARPGQGPVSGAREAQVMIGHPNNSGLQMNQLTQLYIP